MMDSNFDSTNIGGYKESNENVNIVKTEMQNKTDNGNSEFLNKRVPMDGMEELLGQEKVPKDLGKRMDRKNIERSHRMEERHNERKRSDELSDLDEIISDAEAIDNKSNSRFSPSEIRQEERRKRRFLRKKKILYEIIHLKQDLILEVKKVLMKMITPAEIVVIAEIAEIAVMDIQQEENDDVSGYEGAHGSEYTEE